MFHSRCGRLADSRTAERRGRYGRDMGCKRAAQAPAPIEPQAPAVFLEDGQGGEVDFLIERGADLVGVEVKWGARIADRDVAMLFDVFFGIARRPR